jgi:hypothetical protein
LHEERSELEKDHQLGCLALPVLPFAVSENVFRSHGPLSVNGASHNSQTYYFLQIPPVYT